MSSPKSQSEKFFKKRPERLERKLIKKDEKSKHLAFQFEKSEVKMRPETNKDILLSVQPDKTEQELKKLNEELKKSRVELDQKVKERTQELERSETALMSILEDVEESRSALMNMLEDMDEERKKVEKEKNKTLTIIENFADGLLVFDSEHRLSLINPQAEVIFGVESKEVMDKSVSELLVFPNFKPVAEFLLKQKTGAIRKELQIKENLILEVSTIPLITQEEELGSLLILHDVTRGKIIERMKTEFVSLAAHQLRTPLSAVKWTLKILLDGDLGEINQEQRDFIEKTYQSNERMISLINDLLNITRIEEGRYLYKLTLIDIEDVVQSMVNSYKEEADRRGISLTFKKPEAKLPRVSVDLEKIKLAIQNLIDNSIRYTKSGGKVLISLSRKEKEIEFLIKDTGMGIPKDQQGRIFTKFFRAPNVIKTDTEGSGLGLFIVKNIVEVHGGKIWFESEEEKGTTFYFTLPVKEYSI